MENQLLLTINNKRFISLKCFSAQQNDYSQMTCSYKRKISLPYNFQWDEMSSFLTKDGILIITVTESNEEEYHKRLIRELMSLSDRDFASRNLEGSSFNRSLNDNSSFPSSSYSAPKFNAHTPWYDTTFIPVEKTRKFYGNSQYESVTSKFMDGIDSFLRRNCQDYVSTRKYGETGVWADGIDQYRRLRKKNFTADTQLAVLIQDRDYFRVSIY